MATDFFQRQSDARRSTTLLVVLFALAVIGIVGTVAGVTAVAVQYYERYELRSAALANDAPRNAPSLAVPAAAGVITLLLIAGGSLFKIAELSRGGGTTVAESLGGRRLRPDVQDPVERRLLNVVEEMAIASGTPVPPVFLMDQEDGINAFAAGNSPSDAVLGMTRGCAEQLTRSELQGVIAHEFSHILNGDMRMNIRLIGVLNGILLLGLLGQFVFRTMAFSGSGRSQRSGGDSRGGGQLMLVVLAISISLIVLGFIGTVFGNLIKAAVSRQREFLADASAVQFTRDPSGIANALRKIGGVLHGSRLAAPHAAEASHMYFAQGVWEGFSGLWATHPPLKKRIAVIDPSWDGTFLKSLPTAPTASQQVAGFVGGEDAIRRAVSEESALDEVPVEVLDHAVEQVGEPTLAHQEYAQRLLAAVPGELLEAARDPYGARAVVYCLLMDRDAQVRQLQIELLDQLAETDVTRLTRNWLPTVDALDVRGRLPLVDVTLPALRSLSITQYQQFAKCFDGLIRADRRLDLFEWVLSRVLMRHLRPQFEPVKDPPTRYYALRRLGHECSVLLSAVAYAGNTDEQAQQSMAAARPLLPELTLTFLPRSACRLTPLQDALRTLCHVASKQRGRLIDAAAAAICADQHVRWRESELLRGISDLLDCPMPPLLVHPRDDLASRP